MSENLPRVIDTNQVGVHEDLNYYVERYQHHQFQKPLADHTRRAFEQVAAKVAAWPGPLILDSCCGVGESTLEIARRFPEALVIGVDKSEQRLSKQHAYAKTGAYQANNILMARADVNDFWRLAAESEWQVTHHFLLYPNPYPKQKHLQRRWYASPVFPSLLKLGGQLEVRSNWQIYIQEFAQALALHKFSSSAEQYEPETYWTPFERKYHSTGQHLWG